MRPFLFRQGHGHTGPYVNEKCKNCCRPSSFSPLYMSYPLTCCSFGSDNSILNSRRTIGFTQNFEIYKSFETICISLKDYSSMIDVVVYPDIGSLEVGHFTVHYFVVIILIHKCTSSNSCPHTEENIQKKTIN